MSAPDRTTESSEPTTGSAPSLARAWTWLVALAGGVLLAACAVDLISGDAADGDSWTVVALALGGLFLVLGPVILPRLASASVGVHGFSFDLSRSIDALGATDTARRVDRWGGSLTEAANAYASAHTVLTGPEHAAARTRLQDHFVDEAKASALVQQYDAHEVRELFRSAPPVLRVLVLGLMQGDPSLADSATIEAAVTRSRTANEQYQGLRLAKLVGPRLPADERRRLRAAIEADPIIRTGQHRTTLAAEVLVLLADGDDGEPSGEPGRAAVEAGAGGDLSSGTDDGTATGHDGGGGGRRRTRRSGGTGALAS